MARPAENITPIPETNGTQYHGEPCPVHGTTQRYVCNRACVACTRVRSASQPRYGLTQDQVDALLMIQGGRCAICDTANPGTKMGWHVDHDHATGRARGVLCHGCNVGLGQFKDSVENIRRAAEYLTGDLREARLFLVREAAFAGIAFDGVPRSRAADVDGHRGPTPHMLRGPRKVSKAMSREEYLARRKEAYRLRKLERIAK